jgi:ADP-ribosylglycohydrolase
MWGAIIGDIVGSPYEWDNIKTVDFPLFSSGSHFTDDTVMTLAVAEGLMDAFGDEARVADAMKTSILKYGGMFPSAGYGVKFWNWMFLAKNKNPYNSLGNGSAMRVSSVAWAFDDISAVEKYARVSSSITHNHPEGIKGAMSVAGAIFLARSGNNKGDIKKYVEDNYQYDLSRTLNDIRPNYRYNMRAPYSVPEAIIAFLESETFEDAIRKAVSIGGDSDTIAAIAGSIAEGFYGIPDDIRRRAENLLDERLLSVVKRWGLFLENRQNASLVEEIDS